MKPIQPTPTVLSTTLATELAPPLPSPAIDRNHLLETISQIPLQSNPVVFLEGAEGEGATTLLTQFAHRYADRTISLFIRPASRFSYAPDYLRMLLAEQYWWYLYGKPLDVERLDVSLFEGLQLRVRQKLKHDFMYVLVDGLHQIPKEDHQIVSLILKEVLPIGLDCFRFVITGAKSNFSTLANIGNAKEYRLLRFSEAESEVILHGIGLKDDDLSELRRICQGIPGRLAAVRRLIQSGVSPELILRTEPDKYLSFIELEFSALENLSEPDKTAIAVLAFSRHISSIDELIEILPTLTSDSIANILERCTFLSTNTDRAISFVSESHRGLASRRLERLRKIAISLQIKHLVENPKSSAAIKFLPEYYASINSQQAIIDLLSQDHYLSLLEDTQSLSALRARATLGARSALNLKRAINVFQFSIQRSIFSASNTEGEFQSEIGALIALGESKLALNIASNVNSKERRLMFLAEFARRKRESGSDLDREIVDYVGELANQIDFSTLGENVIKLCENLLFVDPDLALSIVDKLLKNDAKDAKKDALFAHLSITASLSRTSDRDEVNDKTRSKISDESLRKLLSSVSQVFSTFSFEALVATASRMPIDRRIYFLRSLISAHATRPHALEIVDYALEQLISNSAYIPKARDLSEFAFPLALSPAQDRVPQVAKRIEAQIGLIENNAPSTDVVQLNLRLALAELRFDPVAAAGRFDRIYYDAAAQKNIEVRINCLSAILSSLHLVSDDFAGAADYKSVVRSDLVLGINELLANSASQFEILSQSIASLSTYEPSTAFGIALRLNTEERRDDAFALIAKAIASAPYCDDRWSTLSECIQAIFSVATRDSCVDDVIDAILRSSDTGSWSLRLSELASLAIDPKTKGSCYARNIEIYLKYDDSELVDAAHDQFNKCLEQVDSVPTIVDMHFDLAARLGQSEPDLARKHYESASALRDSTVLSSERSIEVIGRCISLLSRVFRPLIRANKLPEQAMQRFCAIVDSIPSESYRCIVYGNLAIRAWCEGRGDLCKEIVTEKCRPLLEGIGEKDSAPYMALASVLFPALYFAHPASAYLVLDCAPEDERPYRLHQTALTVMRRIAPSEPWPDDSRNKVILSGEALLDVADLLSRVDLDVCFYNIVKSACDSISDKINRTKLTGQQKADFANKIEDLISKKLPDQKNIKHEGFVIASRAQVLRLKESRREQWQRLLDEAESIDNVADRCYMLIEIAQCLPAKFIELQRELASRARDLIQKIPSARDRDSRLSSYIELARGCSPSDAKAALKDAFSHTMQTDDQQDAARYRKDLLDLAEMMQPELVDELIEMVDEDPARANEKAQIERAAEIQRLKKKISSSNDIFDSANLRDDCLPAAAWKNVSSLIANRIETRPPEGLAAYVDAAGAYNLSDAFPVLSWYIENSARRFKSDTEVSRDLAPLAEVILLSTEIALSVISRASVKRNLTREVSQLELEGITTTYIVRQGERLKALGFIREWLRANQGATIILCDAYFSFADIEFVRMVLSEAPGSRLTVLTSKKAVYTSPPTFDSETFMSRWNEAMDQDPPAVEIIALSRPDSDLPVIHDRWLLTDSAGLRIGTSFNSIGVGKLSEMSAIGSEEASRIFQEITPYIRKERVVAGARVAYISVNI